jgi:hypothetical protein
MRYEGGQYYCKSPEEMAEVLSVYSELKVSKRKANTKALNRAKKAQEV